MKTLRDMAEFDDTAPTSGPSTSSPCSSFLNVDQSSGEGSPPSVTAAKSDELARCSRCGWRKFYHDPQTAPSPVAQLDGEKSRFSDRAKPVADAILGEVAQLLRNKHLADTFPDLKEILSSADDVIEQLEKVPSLISKLSFLIFKERSQVDKLRQQALTDEQLIKELKQQLKEKDAMVDFMQMRWNESKIAINEIVDCLSNSNDSKSIDDDLDIGADVENAMSEDAEESESESETDGEEAGEGFDEKDEYDNLFDKKLKRELLMMELDCLQSAYANLVDLRSKDKETIKDLKSEMETFQVIKSIDDAVIEGLKFTLQTSADQLNNLETHVSNTKAIYNENARLLQQNHRLQSEIVDLNHQNDNLATSVFELRRSVDVLQASKRKDSETIAGLNEKMRILTNQVSFHIQLAEQLMKNNTELYKKIFEQKHSALQF